MITRRVTLIVVLCTVQTVLLIGAWLYTFSVVRRDFDAEVGERVFEMNKKLAGEFAGLVRRNVNEPIRYGSSSWAHTQSLVESLDLLGGAWVCLVDAGGRILCHPELDEDPGLRSLRVEAPEGMGAGWVPLEAEGAGLFGEGTDHLANRPIDGVGARLLLHQPADGLMRIGEQTTRHVLGVAGLALVGTGMLFAFALLLVMGRYEGWIERANAELERELERRYGQSLATRHALIIGLAKLADCRDTDTGEHLDRISIYAAMLAEEMRRNGDATIDDDWIECIRLASTLHDIGKVGVPDRVLLKPGALDETERLEMQRHSAIGAEALRAIRDRLEDDELVEMCIEIARWHHERWDGGGYPDGLAGGEIPLSARIVAVADAYDAMTSRRVYKPAMPHLRAVEIILQDAGSHFDPAVSEALRRIHPKFEAIRYASARGTLRAVAPAASGELAA